LVKQSLIVCTLAIAALLSACGTWVAPGAPERAVSDNSAVLALVKSARADTRDGRMDSAVATLERALRIEPHNPVLWQELARLRLQQGQYQESEGLAARSNGWSGNDPQLRAENWRIIGQSRLKRGDYAGAQSAFDKADAELSD